MIENQIQTFKYLPSYAKLIRSRQSRWTVRSGRVSGIEAVHSPERTSPHASSFLVPRGKDINITPDIWVNGFLRFFLSLADCSLAWGQDADKPLFHRHPQRSQGTESGGFLSSMLAYPQFYSCGREAILTG
jgi:hypothetical protein